MRKLFYAMALVLLSIVTYGQAVNESAIIPVSVTLNAVSRLNVESGGNIKFVFNSIDDYNTGFDGSTNTLYTTTVSIASSRDYAVNIYADGASFSPTDVATNTLAIGNLEYFIDWDGTNPAPASLPAAFTQMTAASFAFIDNTVPADGGVAGDGTANRFIIQWRIGTNANVLDTFLEQGNIPADHYSANIFLELVN